MRSFVLCLSLISISSMACADLSGTYSECRSTENNRISSTNLVVKQTVTNSITTYTATSTDSESQERSTETFLADGLPHTTAVNQDGVQLVVTTTSTCQAQGVSQVMIAQYQGQIVGQVSTTVTKKETKLMITSTGQIGGEEVSESVVCK